MTKRVKSAKGVIVDFDHLHIKEKLLAAPAPVDVKIRQNFIESRLKRRAKKAVVPIEVAPVLPSPAEVLPEAMEVLQEPEPVAKPVTKQRARKKPINKEE